MNKIKPFRKCSYPGCKNVGCPRGKELSFSGNVRRKWCGKHVKPTNRVLPARTKTDKQTEV